MKNVLYEKYPVFYCNICKKLFKCTKYNFKRINLSSIISKPNWQRVVVCDEEHFDCIYQHDEDYSDLFKELKNDKIN